ncbi:hypothetical protein [Lentzea terrae]|uniref:hypothetical protein n=1 Tax=Lentzea terrae TaxID=2200761 RepID=UPI0013008B3A|nr:hypothetical protein [Lentzea terrae]
MRAEGTRRVRVSGTERRGYHQEYSGISVLGLMDFAGKRPRLVHQAFTLARPR